MSGSNPESTTYPFSSHPEPTLSRSSFLMSMDSPSSPAENDPSSSASSRSRFRGRAWVHISENPAIGTGQKQNWLWKSVHDHWRLIVDNRSPVRSVESLEARWKVIQYEVSKRSASLRRLKVAVDAMGLMRSMLPVNYSVRAQQQLENQERSFSSCIAMSISKNARSSALDIYKKRSQQLSRTFKNCTPKSLKSPKKHASLRLCQKIPTMNPIAKQYFMMRQQQVLDAYMKKQVQSPSVSNGDGGNGDGDAGFDTQ
ncbi:hypothetical protein O0I10_003455 [Lichtheimia ornata]|uniref:No apical meristem-associated C-terminal domain-containing protein n=1 Tax=Lichtheimia ornata TaxID=688661 RepID=A0AAD7VAA7_9FUNG|nr:uncharacterized protein O0I10_003455 [Lichtheimia ornata]KAJ8660812.1 hypothetical protein O0I10_003455 [Lichtheimia ornata]